MKWLPYEGKFRIFLVLLVLLMVLLVFFQTQVLRRVQAEFQEEAKRRIRLVSEEVAVALRKVNPADPARPIRAGEAESLRRLARRQEVLAIDLIGSDGVISWSSLSSRVGTTDPRTGSEASSPRKRSAPAGFAPKSPYSSRFTFLPAGSFRWRIEHPTASIDTTRYQLRTLAWIQGTSILVALVAVLVFARWTLDPYRRLVHTVREAVGENGHARNRSDHPEFLLDSFRGVLGKLEAQETELSRLRERSSHPFGDGMLERMASGYMFVREDGAVSEVNPAAAALLGMDRADLVGRDYRNVIPASSRLRELLRQALEEDLTCSREVVPFARGDRLQSHLGVSACPVLEEGRRPRGAICLLTDLTEIREVEERVRKRETLATVGKWSAGMAHEFRNSLGTILGLTRLLMRRLPSQEKENAVAILEEVRGASRNVEDFLKFGRPARLQLAEVDLGELLARLSAQVEAEFPSRISIRREGEFPRIRADADLLRQGFQNLLRNAVESGGDAGNPVEVRVRGIRIPNRNRIRIEVTDSGQGISPADLPHIFTPFYTTKAAGSGLGLPLARRAFLSHDGDLQVESLPGKGTRFQVELSLTPPAPTSPDEEGMGSPGSYL